MLKQKKNDGGPPDVAEIMRQIRSEVRSAYRSGDLTVRRQPQPVEIDSKDLHAANGLWDFPRRPIRFKSHRAVVGPIINRIKQSVSGLIRDRLLAQTFQAHYDFNGAIVRYLNQLNLRINTILRRSADDLESETYSIENRLNRRFEEQIKTLVERTAGVESQNAQIGEQLATIDSVVRGLERLAARSAHPPAGAAAAERSIDAAAPDAGQSDYLLLENRFRGSGAVITDRLREYPPLFFAAVKPVLEIGAGRGELQLLFREKGIPSYGIDLDPGMTADAAASGFDVRCADAAAHLRGLEPGALGGAIAIQVIEHLNQPYLKELLQLLRSRICPGGLVVFETVNTASIVALTQNYLRDPTHMPPIHPESMRFIMELAGFEVVELKNRSPFPELATLLPLHVENQYTPGSKEMAAVFNENIRRLNALLFGYQDYSLTLRVPLN